jgi:hypothetical protein
MAEARDRRAGPRMTLIERTVVGRKRMRGGESRLVARSGLRFATPTVAQQAALADTLQHVAAALQPIA